MEIRNRRRGCLLGLSIGDSLGAPVEFRQFGTFPPVVGYQDGGPHMLSKGQWTDDTSMALALADSIGNMGWNLTDQIKRYCEWWQEGKYSVNGHCFDIGTTTRYALGEFVDHQRLAADASSEASGNGSIMRLAPVPIHYYRWYPNNIRELSTVAEDSSRTTHASEQCKSACRYMTLVLAALINGEERDKVLDPNWGALQELIAIKPLNAHILKVAMGSYKDPTTTILGSGWVVQSLEAALWAFHDADNFEEAVLKAVNLGMDADSTGAVCGQFAGAYWGESGIPICLRDGLDRKDMIEQALSSILGEANVST